MKFRAIWIVIVIFLFGLMIVSPGKAALTDNLIGYWPFNGSGADLSGGGKDVRLYGSADGSGLFGQALSLPGNVNYYAQRPGDDQVFNFGSGSFTVQVWVNFTYLAPEQTLVEKFEGSTGPGWSLSKLQSNQVQFYGAGMATVNSKPESPLTEENHWYHLVFRRDVNNMALFIDGTATTTDFFYGDSITDTTMPLLIGKRNELDNRGFPVNGLIDEVAIWNRALSDQEITYLYNGGNGNPIGAVPLPTSGLLLGSGLFGLAGWRRFRKN